MKLVRIIKNWTEPDLLQQTPGRSGIWNDMIFTLDPVEDSDYVVVLNCSPQKIHVFTYPEHVWSLQQEPPYDFFQVFHRAPKVYHQVFTTDPTLSGSRYIHSQPALPWHISKTYDELQDCKVPDKRFPLSFITSLKSQFPGHKKRVDFLDKIRDTIPLDIIATDGYFRKIYPSYSKSKREQILTKLGYTKIVEEKWDGLAPYRYSMIVENYHGPDYWSEKLADCFLAWTIPMYYGCTNLSKYFPQNSFIEIDIDDPKVNETIDIIIKSNAHEKNKKALKEARNLVLNEYQLFPFITRRVKEWEKKHPIGSKQKKDIMLPKGDSLLRLAIHKIKRIL